MKFFGIALAALCPLFLYAQQQPTSPEEEEKQFRQAIDKQIEDLTNLLDLEYWQVFYLDSIFTHDYSAMRDEMKALSNARVSNAEAYERIQDKWMESIYHANRKVFNDEQWAKYLKSGAQRAKKARDKRAEKRNQ